MGVYCLYCETGRENRVGEGLTRSGFRVIPSLVELVIVKNKKSSHVVRQLLPGYVFFESEAALRAGDWATIKQDKHIYRPLSYVDGSKELRGDDLLFVELLERKRGLLGISKAIAEGTRVKIIDGPLKELEGKIIKVNRKRRCAEVAIESVGVVHRIWLSYELIKIHD
jgi:transcriptional antiterminator NusG